MNKDKNCCENRLCNHHKKFTEKRWEYTKNIIKSKSNKKVVVAGPGTGKTFLFSEVFQNTPGTYLTLSFINALVDDLSLALYGLSDVRTLHGFSLSRLKKVKDASIFPKLSEVIKEDAEIFLGKDVDYTEIFQQGEVEEERIAFYKMRRDYYGKYYGFDDVVFELVNYFKSNNHKIPAYSQVVVDEFQDFNKVEVALIDLLSEKSPILVSGDDDQSLYADLKKADPHYIREKHSPLSTDYSSFSLPFCSRCTKVIVETTNDIVNAAMKEGLLKSRIEKPFIYFSSRDKDKESEDNPTITYVQKYEKQIPDFIQKAIAGIAKKERRSFQVLVIIPPHLKLYSLPYIANSLKKKGFRNISYPSGSDNKKPELLDGLRLLLVDKKSNLGWRIIAKMMLDEDKFISFLRGTEHKGKEASKLLSKEVKDEVKEMLKTMKLIMDQKEVPEDKLAWFFDKIKYNPYNIISDKFRDEILDVELSGYENPRGIRDIPITVTTIPRAKGLSSDYVFITHFDDNFYSYNQKGDLSDKDVFNFLVALTRAKRKLFLISTKKSEPSLLRWIDKSIIEYS